MEFNNFEQLFQGNSVLSFIIALLGSTLVRTVDKVLNKKSESYSEGERLRTELREELDDLKRENYTLNEELESWKHRYYVVFEENIRFRTLYSHLSPLAIQPTSGSF